MSDGRSEIEQLARRAIAAWNEGGDEAILPYLDEGVVWHPPAESMEPGTYRGHAGALDYLGRIGEMFSDRRIELVETVVRDDETVVAVIRVVARSERFEIEIDAEWAWHLRIRDGRAVEVRMFTDKAAALAEAG